MESAHYITGSVTHFSLESCIQHLLSAFPVINYLNDVSFLTDRKKEHSQGLIT